MSETGINRWLSKAKEVFRGKSQSERDFSKYDFQKSESDNAEVFDLNDEFQLFDPSQTRGRFLDGHRVCTARVIKLRVTPDIMIPFAINFINLPDENNRGYITPFNPEFGAAIKSSDFDIQTRTKPHTLTQTGGEDYDFLRLYSVMEFTPTELLQPHPTIKDAMEFRPEIRSLLGRLRFGTTFPSETKDSESDTKVQYMSKFKSNSSYAAGGSGTIGFDHFYPADVQDAPPVDYNKGLREGLSIAVPRDAKKLQTIKGFFYLEDLDNQQNEPSTAEPPTSSATSSQSSGGFVRSRGNR